MQNLVTIVLGAPALSLLRYSGTANRSGAGRQGGTPAGGEAAGRVAVRRRPLEQEPLLAARIMIEDCLALLLDVQDIDRLFAASPSAAPPPPHPYSSFPTAPSSLQLSLIPVPEAAINFGVRVAARGTVPDAGQDLRRVVCLGRRAGQHWTRHPLAAQSLGPACFPRRSVRVTAAGQGGVQAAHPRAKPRFGGGGRF